MPAVKVLLLEPILFYIPNFEFIGACAADKLFSIWKKLKNLKKSRWVQIPSV
jgi:hypothetical protein